AVVERTADDPDFRKAASPDSPLASSYQEKFWNAYQAYVSRIRACVLLPLNVRGRTQGVVRMARESEGPFDPGTVRLVEGLAQVVAAQEITFLLGSEARSRETRRPSGLGSVEKLVERLIERPRPAAQT